MSQGNNVLVLVGSPKGKISVSHILSQYLADRLSLGCSQVGLRFLAVSRKTPDSYELLLQSMAGADVLAFVFPLYADQLPSGLVETLERYSQYREDHPEVRTQSVAAIVNCGFPEPEHNRGALNVLKRFTEIRGLRWLGGLSLGGGGIVDAERPLTEQGGRVRRITRALDLTATALQEGWPVPEEAERLASRLIIPRFLYRWIGDWGFQKEAKRWGNGKKELVSSPFAAPV
jgi:hypothetical protein